jgi:hypothetical protein
MQRTAALLATCLALAATFAPAQTKDKDLKAYLDGVTERGRALYAYDQAAWHGTDAFFELKPDTKGLTHYLCVKGPAGWRVVFPRWNESHDKLLIAYEALESAPGKYEGSADTPPAEASEALTAMERALELVFADFPRPSRPYNSAILPADGGNFYVYLYPGQTKTTIWPLGGDVRYTISADGRRIVEKRQLHKTVLNMQFDPNLKIVGGQHSHVLSDVPEDTDVLYVLNRRPSIPEYIGAGKRVFEVQTDGSIQVVKK